jgi:PKD repeat protein
MPLLSGTLPWCLVLVLLLAAPGAAAEAATGPDLQEMDALSSGATDGPLTMGSAGALEFGTTYAGTLSQPNERDSFTVTLREDDVLYVRMNSDWSQWPNIRVYNPDMSLLAQTSTQQDRNELTVSAPIGGTYTVLIGDWEGDDTGAYSFYVQRLNEPGLATVVQPGQVIASEIVQHSEFDTFTFQALSGDHVMVRMNSGWALWPHIRIYRPDGALLDKTSTQQDRNEVTVLAPTTGTYTMMVGDWEGESVGNYSFYVQNVNAPGDAVPIEPGRTQSAGIARTSEFDTYTFQSGSDDRYLVRINSDWPLWPHVRIYGPGGTLVDKTSTQQDHNELTINAEITGTYTLLVGDWEGDSVGNYSVYLQRLNGPEGGRVLRRGQTVTGSIDGWSEFDTYTINPLGGTAALLTMTSSWPLWPHIRVYGPDGTLVDKTSTQQDQNELTITAERNGTYTVLVGDWEGTDTGTYTLYAFYRPGPVYVARFPGGIDPPTDPDGDGVYDDINGNGRPDFADVVLFFNNMDWIAGHQPEWRVAFDCNGNGRIDFADVVWLFNRL